MGVRTVIAGVVLIGIAAGGGILYRHLDDARIDREAARLTALLEKDLAEYHAGRHGRPPAPGEPTVGDAADWYRKAFEAFENCGIDPDRLYRLGRKDEGIGDLLREVRPILDLVAMGARARFTSVVIRFGDRSTPAIAARIGELLILDSSRRPERLLTAFRFGGDLSIGKPFEVSLEPTREAAVEGLTRRIAAQRAAGPELDSLVALLRAELVGRPDPWDALHAEILDTEMYLRAGLEDTDGHAPVAEDLGLTPTRSALVDAWIELREFSGRRDPADPPPFLHAGRVTAQLYERSRLELSALLLGALMLREKHRTGAFPTDLVALRPPEVTATPAEGRWTLEPDRKTGLPAIYIRDGRPLRVVTEAEKGLPLPPAFEFRETQ
jgi:hypothetical protein